MTCSKAVSQRISYGSQRMVRFSRRGMWNIEGGRMPRIVGATQWTVSSVRLLAIGKMPIEYARITVSGVSA